MAFALIPDVVSGQTIRHLKPGDSALDAARLMVDFDISAVVVLDEEGRLAGIVTERDLARRVVAAGHSGDAVTMRDVMTRTPDFLPPDASPFDALELMHDRRIRHIPLVDDGSVVGMVSIRDLRHAIAGLARASKPLSWRERLGW